MSAYPLMLRGDTLSALVVGGGSVAERKVRSLLEAGAAVRVVARELSPALRTLASSAERLTVEERSYAPGDIADAMLVVAVTDDRALNARVAADAKARRRLANVADRPSDGNCVSPAVHRAGTLVIAVTAGGVPTAAARIRDAIARNFDDRYAAALATLAAIRGRLLDSRDRAGWRRALDELAGESFCDDVERGRWDAEVTAWR